jgi:hypothetical protein
MYWQNFSIFKNDGNWYKLKLTFNRTCWWCFPTASVKTAYCPVSIIAFITDKISGWSKLCSDKVQISISHVFWSPTVWIMDKFIIYIKNLNHERKKWVICNFFITIYQNPWNFSERIYLYILLSASWVCIKLSSS